MYSDSLAMLYKAGEVIAGRYRIVKVLGAGGMGVVLAARHEDLDTLVAIKLLRPEVLSNRDVVARFAAEARAAVRIKSEHVARVTDVNTLPDGAPYMVMEYLEGSDLAALVEQRGPLSVEDAVDYVLQACEALTEAHCLGIVHRDLKPGNLFLSLRADGSEIVKVLDFGISKSLDGGAGGGASLTGTGAILGSPTYMSPEQLSNSKTVDRRTDIWAIGVILHQILSGQLPFKADTLPELFMAIVQNQPPPLRNIRPDVPPGLAAVVLRCLEKDRARRFESVGELAVALAPFAPQRSRISVERILRMTPVAMTDSMASQTATQGADGPAWHLPTRTAGADTQGTWGHTASKPSRSAPQKFLIAFVGLAALAGAGFAVRTWVWPGDAVAPLASASAQPTVQAATPALAVSRELAETAPAAPAAKTEAAALVEAPPDPPPLAQVQPAPARAVPIAAGRLPGRTPRTPARHGDSAGTATAAPEPAATHTSAAPAAAPPATSAVRAAPAATAPPKPHSDWEEDRR